MITDINSELWTFFLALLTGAIAACSYSLGRSMGIFVKKQAVRDALKWIFAAAVSIVLWQKLLSGQLRWYIVIAMILSAVLYFLTADKYIFAVFSFFVRKIYSFFNIILKILLTIKDFLGKILSIYTGKSNKKIRRKVRN